MKKNKAYKSLKFAMVTVFALAVAFTCLFANTNISKAAEAKTDVLLEETSTATANTEVSHNFTVATTTDVNFYVLVPDVVNCKVGIYNSADKLYKSVTISNSTWELAQGVYGYALTISDMKAGDYTIKLEFDKDTEYIVAVESEKVIATINTKSATLTVGFKKTLKVDNTKDKITWTSSKKTVATVSSKGVVTAKKPGTTTITAKTASGQKLTCKITVKANTFKETKLSISKVPYSKCGLQVYSASYAKNGDLVIKCRFLNNSGYKVTGLKNSKIVFKTDAGKTIGTYSMKSKSMSVSSGSTKDFSVTIKKSSLKIKKADLRNASYKATGTYVYKYYY